MSGYTTATLAIFSAAMGTYGAIEQSNTQKQQAEYQADMAQYNAQVAEGQAKQAEEEGQRLKKEADENATRKRQETALLVGKQRAKQGASGAVLDVGSNLDVNLDTTERGELDALQLENQGIFQDYNKQVDAQNYRNQAGVYQSQAQGHTNRANQYSPFLDSGNTLLSGVKNVHDEFINLK